MIDWFVVRRFRKSGNSYYEVSNKIEIKLIFGYKNLLKFMGGAR
jgi:hypothetical protein